jgi:ABC-type nitrate/sulfonate/bicarbonate transport system substrate-binding protein
MRFWKLSLFFTSVMAVVGFNFSAAAAPEEKLIRVRVAIPSTSLSQLPLQVGARLGMFKAEGLEVAVEEIRPTAAIAGLVNGELQFTSAGSSAFRAAASGASVKLLTGGSEKPAFFLVAQPEINKVTDLRSKIIAVTSLRPLTDMVVHDVLKHHGMDADKDARIVALRTTANILAGLTVKQAHAGLLSPPFDYQAKKLGLRILLFAGDHVRFLQGGFASSNQQIAANPDMIRRFIRGYIRSIHFTQSQKEKTFPVMMKILQLDEEAASQTYDSVKGIWRADGGVSKAVLQKESDMWKESTKQARDVSLEEVTDFSFLRQVQQELNVKPLD